MPKYEGFGQNDTALNFWFYFHIQCNFVSFKKSKMNANLISRNDTELDRNILHGVINICIRVYQVQIAPTINFFHQQRIENID